MIQRFVCFKFKEGVSQEAVQEHMIMLAALKEVIPQIISYEGGFTFLDGKGSEAFDTAHRITFQTKADMDSYFHHQAHQVFIESNKMNWAEVLVVDSEISTD